MDVRRLGKILEYHNSVKEILDHYERKQHKSWFDEGCSELLCYSTPAEFQWLLDQLNGHKLTKQDGKSADISGTK